MSEKPERSMPLDQAEAEARRIQHLADLWSDFLDNQKFEDLIEGVTPKDTGCGKVFELPNYLDTAASSFAVADMRDLEFSEPHYHVGETEIYYVMQGNGRIAIGNQVSVLKAGKAVITPPETAHYIFASDDLVLGVINTPEFNGSHQISLAGEDAPTHPTFDRQLFQEFTEPQQP